MLTFLVLLTSLGLEQGITRFFYEKNTSKFNLIFASLKYSFYMYIFIIFILVIFQKYISIFIFSKEEVDIILVFGIGILCYVLYNFSILIIRLKQKSTIYSSMYTLNKVLEIIFISYFFLKFKDSYKTLLFPMIISLGLIAVICIFLERNLWFNLNRNIDKEKKKELLKYSIPLCLTSALTWIFGASDKIIINYFCGIEEVGIYSGAFKIISILLIIQNGFITFWVPLAYERFLKHPNERDFFKKANEYVALLFFSLGVGVIMSRNLMIVFLGNNYREAVYILPILIFIPLMQSISETTSLGINFTKKTKYSLYISIIVTIFNVIGNVLAVKYFYGIKGVAMVTGLSYIIFFILRTIISKKLLNFDLKIQKLYLITILVYIYTMLLMFYNNIFYEILCGIILEIIILKSYFSITKEIYLKYIQKFFIKFKNKIFE